MICIGNCNERDSTDFSLQIIHWGTKYRKYIRNEGIDGNGRNERNFKYWKNKKANDLSTDSTPSVTDLQVSIHSRGIYLNWILIHSAAAHKRIQVSWKNTRFTHELEGLRVVQTRLEIGMPLRTHGVPRNLLHIRILISQIPCYWLELLAEAKKLPEELE